MRALILIFAISFAAHGQRILGLESTSSTSTLVYRDLTTASVKVLAEDSQVAYAADSASGAVSVARLVQRVQGKPPQMRLQIVSMAGEQATSQTYPDACFECPTCVGCNGTVQLALSSDKRYVFSAFDRFHQQPGDDGPSFKEQVAVTYDTAERRFLDKHFALPESTLLQSSPEPEGFDYLVSNSHGESNMSFTLMRQRLSEASPIVVNEIKLQARASKSVYDAAHHRTLIIRDDGLVLEASTFLRNIGTLSLSMPPSREMYAVHVSADGKLLFVVMGTGPENPATLFAGRFYVDRIEVYDAMTLGHIRSLQSQRPLEEVVPNHDGSRLYATTANSAVLLELNGETLWQEDGYRLRNPIRKIAFVP